MNDLSITITHSLSHLLYYQQATLSLISLNVSARHLDLRWAFLPTKSNKGTRHLSQHSSTDTPRDIRPHRIHTPRFPHPLTYTTDIDRFIHTEMARLKRASEDGIRWKMGEGRSPEHEEEENGSLGDFIFLLTLPMLSSLRHWLQPITNSNVIMSSASVDQRLMSRLRIEWFPEASEERFDMENAKTSQAYPSLPLIHGMMLRLSLVSRLGKHTYTRRSAKSYPYVSPECLYGH